VKFVPTFWHGVCFSLLAIARAIFGRPANFDDDVALCATGDRGGRSSGFEPVD
jgi:hypothetical protein